MARTKQEEEKFSEVTISSGDKSVTMTGKEFEERTEKILNQTVNPKTGEVIDYPSWISEPGYTLVFGIDDPDYPSEWIRDEHNKPTCTAFVGLNEITLEDKKKLEDWNRAVAEEKGIDESKSPKEGEVVKQEEAI